MNLERMRNKVRRHVLKFLRQGDRILEMNAGTGVDAEFFARMGFRVHATDVSQGMIARMQARLKSDMLQGCMSVQQCDFRELGSATGGPFEHIFSNMGGVNCMNDLERTALSVGSALAPGGKVTWVVMPPVCLWELAAALRGDLRTMRRRQYKQGVIANVEGVEFRTWYYTPEQVIQAFGAGFRLLLLEGLSVFTPPADYKQFPHNHPHLFKGLCRLDNWLANRPPFNHWGDFYIITLGQDAR